MRMLASPVMLVLAMLMAACSNPIDPETGIAKAQAARDRKDYPAAIVILKDVLQRAPEHPEARYVLGLAYGDAGDFRFAEQELRRARELGFDPVRVTPAHGRALLKTGAFEAVLDETRLETAAPDRVQAELLSLRAHALIGLGRTGQASDLLEQALSLHPEYWNALLGQARIAIAARKIDAANALITRATQSAPQNVDVWMMKGDLARYVGDAQAAASAYAEVLELDPNNAIGIANSARMLIAKRDLNAARERIKELRKRAPQHPVTLYLDGLLAYQQKDYPAARASVQQVLKLAPDHLEALLLGALTESALGSHDQAQGYLAQVLKRAPGSLYAHKLMIVSLARSGREPRAIDMVERLLPRVPDDRQLTQIAGELYLRTGDFTKAVEQFERIARLDPDNVQARAALGLSRFSAGDTERALTDVEAASRLDTEDYSADMLLVVLNLRSGKHEQALQAARTLERKQPKNPAAHSLIGSVYNGLRDFAKARTHFERALELDPAYTQAAVELARLDLADKKPREARGRLESLVNRNGSNMTALMALASLAPVIGASDKERVAWLERAHGIDPDAPRPMLMLALAYQQSGNLSKALETARRAQALHPERLDVLETLGVIQLSAGEGEQALRTYERAVALHPRSVGSLYKLAVAQAARNDEQGAKNSLRKAVSIQPDFIDAQVMLAKLEMKAGRREVATKIAADLKTRLPKSAAGLLLEGELRMMERQYKQAGQAYAAAYDRERDASSAVKFVAAYSQLRLFREARERIVQWLEKTPNDPILHRLAAEVSYQAGDYRYAIERYEWLLERDPKDVQGLNNLALAYHGLQDPRAVATAERARSLEPNNPALADTLGWILVERGDAKRGIPVLEQALEASPQNFEIRFHLAQAHIKIGEHKKAYKMLDRLLNDYPNAPNAAEVRRMAEGIAQ